MCCCCFIIIFVVIIIVVIVVVVVVVAVVVAVVVVVVVVAVVVVCLFVCLFVFLCMCVRCVICRSGAQFRVHLQNLPKQANPVEVRQFLKRLGAPCVRLKKGFQWTYSFLSYQV